MEERLNEILVAFKWTWENMGSPHTSDHFNIPVNAIKDLELIIEDLKNNPIAKAQKSIEERKISFSNNMRLHGSDYGVQMLIDFFNYWTEHGENAKKMRFEKEKVFDIKKRLERWNRNQKPTTNGTTTSEALNKFITE